MIPKDAACFHTRIIVCKRVVSLVIIFILYDCKLSVVSVKGANSKPLHKTTMNSMLSHMQLTHFMVLLSQLFQEDSSDDEERQEKQVSDQVVCM